MKKREETILSVINALQNLINNTKNEKNTPLKTFKKDFTYFREIQLLNLYFEIHDMEYKSLLFKVNGKIVEVEFYDNGEYIAYDDTNLTENEEFALECMIQNQCEYVFPSESVDNFLVKKSKKAA